PIRAVFPGAVVPLEHDLARRVGRIQINVGIELVAGVDVELSAGPVEVMLVHSGGNRRLMGELAGERSRVAADPVPGITASSAENSARRSCVFQPDRIPRAGRWRGVGNSDRWRSIRAG